MAGDRVVLRIDAVDVFPSPDPEMYDDHVCDLYAFVGADSTRVIEVTTDSLEPDEVLELISRIEG